MATTTKTQPSPDGSKTETRRKDTQTGIVVDVYVVAAVGQVMCYGASSNCWTAAG